MNNYELNSFIGKDGKLFMQLKDKQSNEVVAGAFFPVAIYKEFFGSLEIILNKLIAAGLAEALDHELERVPDPATFS